MAGNYVRTGPFVNGGAPGIAAAFLNNLEAVLERNSGDTEQGHYFLSGWSNASGDLIQVYIVALSRTSVPISPAGSLDWRGYATVKAIATLRRNDALV